MGDPRDEHLGQSMANIIPTLMEIMAEIVNHIDDPDLTESTRAKLMAAEVVQLQINEGGK